LLIPLISPNIVFNDVAVLLFANIYLSLLVIFFSIYRNQIEVERSDIMEVSNIQLSASYDDTLEGWSRALEFKDKFTVGHAKRVTELCLNMARAGGIYGEELVHMYRGALLHDIGKIGIPDYILFKTDKLTESEMKIVRLHPIWAYEMLEPIPFLRPALPIPYSHHEKWDGSGYPQGLAGKDIPFAVRLFSVADVYDALLSDRPYRKAWEPNHAKEYLRDQSGQHFDPQCIDIFFEVSKPLRANTPSS